MDEQGNNGGILSKFRERLRKIRISRSKKKKQNDKFIQDKVEEIREAIRKDTTPIRRKVRYKAGLVEESVSKEDTFSHVIVDIRKTAPERRISHKKVGKPNLDIINNIKDNDNLVKSSEKVVQVRKHKKVGYVSDKEKNDVDNHRHISREKEELLDKLSADIISRIKNSFEDKLDELQVLESELYFLEKNQENELELNKVKDIKKRINELIGQVNSIIEQYNAYKENYYIDSVIDINDNILVDDIIQYRDLLDSLSLEKEFVKEYKALDEFKRLYLSLKVVRDDAEKLQQSNEKKIEEFDIRDKKYNDIKLQMIPIDDINKTCTYEIAKQNEYFADLMKKINIINREEYTTTHLRGLGELIGRSLNYVGLLMLSPLSGLIPSIAVQTLATKRMIGNIYQNMHVEEIKHIKYNAINYDIELNHHLCDIDYTADLLSDTLQDIERLKEDFLKQYDSRIAGYEDTLKKINAIEGTIHQNQNRVEIIRSNLKRSKKLNEDKLKRVRQLNDN